MSNPKVFISHASEDKDRFVREFAVQLRARGIDAWFDEWDIGPGDSLVTKIFEEGLAESEVVIVVLSAVSIQKRWVRKELNVSVVNRIAGKVKLIPVLIDDCPIPESLKDILHIRIKDPNNYATELGRIVDAIFGRLWKVPLGEPPEYIRSRPIPIAGLHNADQQVLKISCDLALKKDREVLSLTDLAKPAQGLGLSESQIVDSVRILGEACLLDISAAIGTHVSHFRIAPRGFDLYFRNHVASYDAIVHAVASKILDEGHYNSLLIAEALNQPRLLVNHIMNEFASRGFCRKSGEIGTHVLVYDLSPSFRRAFEG